MPGLNQHHDQMKTGHSSRRPPSIELRKTPQMLVNHKKKISFKVYYVAGFARRGNPVAEVELIGLITVFIGRERWRDGRGNRWGT